MSSMTLEQAMRRAFSLGQTYWEQADSESWSKQDKAEGTRQKFEQLLQETLAQPAQSVEVGLVERLRKRAAEERQIAENNARVAEMLAPELARFNVRDAHNIYATRMAIDHRDSAKRDAAFADDLEAAVVAITRAIGNAQAEAALDWNSESTKPSDDPMNASNGE